MTTSADGVCGNRGRVECARIAAQKADTGDDAVLERVEASSKTPPKPRKPKKEKAPPAPPSDVEEFFALAQALGLDPQEMINSYCHNWTAKTRRRALEADDVEEVTPPAEAPAGE